MKKTVDDKINRIDNSKRLNKKVERKYERLENKISKAKGDTEKLKKIDEIRGKKSKAGKLNEIIEFYLKENKL